MPPDPQQTEQYLLGQMNAKLDTLIDQTRTDRAAVEKLSDRVRKLEAWRWMFIGAGFGGGAGGSLLIKAFTS